MKTRWLRQWWWLVVWIFWISLTGYLVFVRHVLPASCVLDESASCRPEP